MTYPFLLDAFCFFLIIIFTYKVFILLNDHWWRPRRIVEVLKRQGIRGPKPRFVLGNLPERNRLRKESTMHDMHGVTHDIVPRLMPDFLQWSKTYGQTFLFWWGSEPRLTLYDPDQIKDILSSKHIYSLGRSNLQRQGVIDFIGKGLIMANGEAWAYQRKVLAPAFHVEQLKHLAGHMIECTCELLEQWEMMLSRKPKDGGEISTSMEVEVSEAMSVLAGDIIARTEFGSSYAYKGKLIFGKLNELQKLSAQSPATISRRGRLHGRRRIQQLKSEVDSLVLSIIQDRRQASTSCDEKSLTLSDQMNYGQDLLGLMLTEMEAANRNAVDPEQYRVEKRTHSKLFASLTAWLNTSSTERCAGSLCYRWQQLIDECKTFFFTGHETTSLLLSWTIMLLACNPAWQERARAEALLHVGAAGLPHVDKLNKLKVLEMILLESLRLYTPATILARQAFKDITIGELHIPEGLSVWVPVLAIHHDKAIWGEDAAEFKPERFAEGVAKACTNPMAFMPFSCGPRNCLGQNYAIMEAKIVLCMLLSRFTFRLSPSYRHAPVFVLTLKPKYGVPIILQRLSSSS